jgi:hypothetical protein
MTTTFSNPLVLEAPNPLGVPQVRAALLEPLLVVASCLLWIAVLPFGGLFCAGVAVYDGIAPQA